MEARLAGRRGAAGMLEMAEKGEYEVRRPTTRRSRTRVNTKANVLKPCRRAGEMPCHTRHSNQCALANWNPGGKLLKEHIFELRRPVEAQSDAVGIVVCNKKTHGTHPGAPKP